MSNIHKIGKELFIISDEEIKEGDWFIANNGVHKCIRVDNNTSCPFITLNSKEEEIGHFKTWRTKIILTTDQDLIKDGIQAIDDEFLEWFVKNPSCKEVETHIVKLCTNCGQQHCDNRDCRGYEDEPQYLISYPENTTQRIITYCDGYEVNTEKIIIPIEEPTMITDWLDKHGDPEIYKKVEKQLELEEAARNYIKGDDLSTFSQRAFFIAGAKWMQERMYSVEDLRTAYAISKNANNFDEWFEQFKKK